MKNRRLATNEDAQAILKAISLSIDHGDLEDELREAGYSRATISETDPTRGFFKIVVSGGENDSGFEATLLLTDIYVGFDHMRIDHTPSKDES